jgi:2'-5' RNA ligase
MSVRSRAAVTERAVPVAKVFGPGVPPGIEAAEARAQMTPSSSFGPGTPIGPYDGYSRQPRSQNFVTGVNIATRPRTHERVSFETLRSLIDAYDIASIAIWHRIDSIRSLDWQLIAAPHFQGDVSDAIPLGVKALKKPDRINSFSSWLAKWLFDVLAYDAGALYRLRNRAGRCIGLLPFDGTTIAPLLDYWGNPPGAMAAPGEELPPSHVQYVNGLPWNWLTRDDLIYQPFRPRTNSPYGHAPLESILLNANTDIRFQLFFLQRFTEGNIPEAFAAAPETWSPDQIEQFQEYWDGFMYGDQSRKHQIRWMPGGSKFAWSNEKEFSDTFSLFLMRKTLAAYHTVPADLGFTENVNRSSGESQADVQHRVGELPLDAYVESVLSDFLQDDLGLPLQFEFDKGEEQDDRLQVAQADEIYMRNAVIGSSEIREMRFGLPEPDGQVVPRGFFTERSGLIPLNSVLAVAGPIDPASAAPEPGAPLPHMVFGGVEGVLPNPPIKIPSLAEQEYGPSAMPPAPPPQPKMTDADATPELSATPVAKDGEGAAGNVTAGITAETGLFSYDLDGQDDEDEDERDGAAVAKELAAFRRFAKARRKGGEWRDFEFGAVPAGRARRLNAEGFAAVRKAAPGCELSPRSGMISLDLPPGTVRPVPGGTAEHHVTVVYLGPDVDDGAFAEACDRARQAAAAVSGPLDGTVSGVGAFPPSASSDGKVPAWAAVAVPGAGVLRDALADLSASEHRDWTPHVTLAYLDPGDPLPAPLEPVPVTFAYLSVHRGEDVERFPLGGDAVAKCAFCPECNGGLDDSDACMDWLQRGERARLRIGVDGTPADAQDVPHPFAAEGRHGACAACLLGEDAPVHRQADVAKAGDARPKAAWHGWALDRKTAAHWAPKVRASVTAAIPPAKTRQIGRDYLADHPKQDGKAKDKRDRNETALAWLLAWLLRHGITLVPASSAEGIAIDGYAIGAVSAQHQVTGRAPGKQAPGDRESASERVGEAGLAALLYLLLHGGAGAAPAAEAVAERIAAGYARALAIILAGTDADWADSQDTLDELGDMLSGALADEDLAVTLVGTEINIYTGLSAHEYYLANSVAWVSWLTKQDGRQCPACQENEDAGPILIGEEFPSGHTAPPVHPTCGFRCAVIPSAPPGA